MLMLNTHLLQCNLVLAPELRKARHLVLIPDSPTFRSERSGDTRIGERGERNLVRSLGVSITLPPHAFGVVGVVLYRRVVQRVL